MDTGDFSTIAFRDKRNKVKIKTITGKFSQLCIIRLYQGEKTWHSHLHEQTGYVHSGKNRLSSRENDIILTAGSAYVIASEVTHGFEAIGKEPAEYIEVFNPPKEENRAAQEK